MLLISHGHHQGCWQGNIDAVQICKQALWHDVCTCIIYLATLQCPNQLLTAQPKLHSLPSLAAQPDPPADNDEKEL